MSLGLTATFFGVLFSDPNKRFSPHHSMRFSVAGVFVILLLATVLRFYELDLYPPGILDEMAGNALFMKPYVSGEKNVLLHHFTSDRPLSWVGNISCILSVYSMKLFGVNPISLRFVSAVSGVLSVLALYFLTKRLFGVQVALLAAFFMATSPWHIFYSRTNYTHYIIPVLQSILAFHFLLIALDRKTLITSLVAGIFMGLSVYTYEPGKATLISTTLFVLVAFGRQLVQVPCKPGMVKNFSLVAVLIMALFITLIPYIRTGLNHSSYFYSLAGPNNMKKAFWTRTETSLSSFMASNAKRLPATLAHDRSSPPNSHTSNLFTNEEKGVLDPVIIVLLVLGLGLALRKSKNLAYALILLWLVISAAPAVATAVLPKRMVTMIPPLFILAGLGANLLLTPLVDQLRGKKGYSVLIIFSSLLLLLFSSLQFRDFKNDISYGPEYHADYMRFRQKIRDAARQTRMYTDINNSVFNLIFDDLPQYQIIPDLQKNLVTMLSDPLAVKSGLSVLAWRHEAGNGPFVASLARLFPETPAFLETSDFILLSVRGQDLANIMGFSPTQLETATLDTDKGPFRHPGSLLVPSTGRYKFSLASPFKGQVFINQNPVELTGQGSGKSYGWIWLTEGIHHISVQSSSKQQPELEWLAEEPNSKKHDLPIILNESVYLTGEFRGVPIFNPRESLVLDWSTDLIGIRRAVDLWVAEDGTMLITDNALRRVTVLKDDGSQIYSFSTGDNTSRMAMYDQAGGIYVLKPAAGKGIERYTMRGEKLGVLPFSPKEMAINPAGEIYLLSNKMLRRLSPDQAGQLKVSGIFPPTDEASPHPELVTMAVAENGTIHLLTAGAKIIRLTPNLSFKSELFVGSGSISTGSQLYGSGSQIAVDEQGRIFIGDPESNVIRVFDRSGQMLVSPQPSANLPLQVKSPIDLMTSGDKLYVLTGKIDQYHISVYRYKGNR
jgi:4-amino-4-deoxy-L-arabinose transferase-like glycosyltransferase